jgi:hypothetical protein
MKKTRGRKSCVRVPLKITEISPAHEVWFQQIPAFPIVLEFTLEKEKFFFLNKQKSSARCR